MVDGDDLKWVKNLRKLPCIGKSFMDVFLLNPLNFSKMKYVSRYVKWCFAASHGLKGLILNPMSAKYDYSRFQSVLLAG